jgi:hypothetical protein
MSERGQVPGNNEQRLLGELRRLAGEVDPVPDEVTSYAKAALGWRRIDAELAELLSDSALDSQAVAATRSSAARARSLTFRTSSLELDVEIREDDPGVVLMGQLAPPGRATVEVQRADGSPAESQEADALGRFRIGLSERGRIRLRIAREAPATPVETSWFDT